MHSRCTQDFKEEKQKQKKKTLDRQTAKLRTCRVKEEDTGNLLIYTYPSPRKIRLKDFSREYDVHSHGFQLLRRGNVKNAQIYWSPQDFRSRCKCRPTSSFLDSNGDAVHSYIDL